jgi:hypothetical protein
MFRYYVDVKEVYVRKCINRNNETLIAFMLKIETHFF